MKLDDILISNSFKSTIPSEKKLAKCRQYFSEHGVLDRKLIIDRHGYLVDGYIGYLVLRENCVTEYDVKRNNKKNTMKKKNNLKYLTTPTTYVYASHKPNKKVYVWRIDNKTKDAEKIKIGKRVFVETSQGSGTVEVLDVKRLDSPPVKYLVKRVLSCQSD